jgi:hypothetical protein
MSFIAKAVKSVGKAISGVVKGVVKAVSSVVKAVVDVAASVVNFIAQPFMGLFGGMPDIPSADQEAQRQQGVLVQTQGSNQNVPVVYGYRKVGGIVTFAETGSQDNRYLYVAYVFSEGVVEGLREVYIDDWQLPVELTAQLNASQLVTVNTDRYKDRVQLQWSPGVYFDNPDKSPVGDVVNSGIFAEAPSFTKDMIYNGLAVLFARYEWKKIETQEDADNNPFSGNIPQVQVAMLGKKVASLLTNTEDKDYRFSSERYSTNPAECLADYLRNPRYGKGLKNDDFDWPSWKRAARKFNQTVTYLSTKSDIKGPILTCNAVVDTRQTLMNNVKTFLQNSRTYMPYVQGKYKLRVEDAGNDFDITSGVATISATFTPDNIVGQVRYTGIERSNKYNSVAINYVDPDEKFSVQQVIHPETEAERQVFIDRDNGRVNRLEATFSNITNYAMAKDFARLLFNKSRRQETASLTVTSQAIELEPGDNIYIQANILDFGTDPWRIVSMKINDDMTVQLGCVRNPDDIYPYVRAGEEDIILPTYVPKGSQIYFPSSKNRPALGLVPPTKAVYPGDFNPNDFNPGNTDPNGPGGGGPGGGNPPDPDGPGPITPPEEPDVPTPIPVPPDNDPPEPPPPPPPFRATLEFVRTDIVAVTDTLFDYTVVFKQPDVGLYERSTFWWRYNQYTAYKEIRLDTKPGPGGEIAVNVGQLPLGNYDYIARSFASDGRASPIILKGQFAGREIAEGAFTGLGGGDRKQVQPGWEIPEPEEAPAPQYDDDIDLFEISPVLSSGVPQDPRKMTVTFAQIDQFLGDKRVNENIKGIRIYYKNRSDEYYNYEDINFGADYFVGKSVTQELSGTFGPRQFPSQVTGVNTSGYQASLYDFVVRLRYKDGTAAEKQLQFSTVVEGRYGVYDFTRTFEDRTRPIPEGFILRTVDQDPNAGYNAALDVIPSIENIDAGYTDNTLEFVFNPPLGDAAIKFAGYKIRFREIIPGQAPAFNEITIGPGQTETGFIIYYIKDNSFKLNTPYEFVITAQAMVAGVRTDATNSLYSKKVIIPRFFYYDEYQLFNFEIKNTKLALRQLTTAFPGGDALNVTGWSKIQNVEYSPYKLMDKGIYYRTGRGNDRIYSLNVFHKLEFEAPSGVDTLVIYRRIYNTSQLKGIGKTNVTQFGKYPNIGPWDRVEIDLSTLTPVNGKYTVHLRGAIGVGNTLRGYFNQRYETDQFNPNLVNPQWGPTGSYPDTFKSYSASGFYPYAGDQNASMSSDEFTQYYLVASTSGTEQDKGIMLRDFNTIKSGANYRKEVDGFLFGNVEKDVVVEKSALNTLESGYGRNLSDYLELGMGKNDLTKFARYNAFPKAGYDGSWYYNVPPFQIFLTKPSTGEDIY